MRFEMTVSRQRLLGALSLRLNVEYFIIGVRDLHNAPLQLLTPRKPFQSSDSTPSSPAWSPASRIPSPRHSRIERVDDAQLFQMSQSHCPPSLSIVLPLFPELTPLRLSLSLSFSVSFSFSFSMSHLLTHSRSSSSIVEQEEEQQEERRKKLWGVTTEKEKSKKKKKN